VALERGKMAERGRKWEHISWGISYNHFRATKIQKGGKRERGCAADQSGKGKKGERVVGIADDRKNEETKGASSKKKGPSEARLQKKLERSRRRGTIGHSCGEGMTNLRGEKRVLKKGRSI